MNVVKKTEIKLFGGRTSGWVEEDAQGNKQAVSFGGKILGYYNKATNTTRDFGGRVVAYGDVVSGYLLYNKI